MSGRSLLILVACALVAVSVWAQSGPVPDDQQPNRQRLAQWRTDPEHYARLQQDLAVFRTMPPERQNRLRQLHRDLHEQDSATEARLRRVLERYAVWLGRLPAADRQRIEQASNPRDRIRLIKEIRERQRKDRLPRAVQEQLDKKSATEREAEMKRLRDEEWNRRADWQVAFRFWGTLMNLKSEPLPARLEDFPQVVQIFVEKQLRRLLSEAEQERLRKAEGQWPLYPRTLVDLADRHVTLPGPIGPMRLTDLPEDSQQKLKKLAPLKLSKNLAQAEGKWPDFAVLLLDLARRRNVSLSLPPKDIPSRLEDFNPSVQQFFRNELVPALSEPEKEHLRKAEGQWPLYPRTLLELACVHDLQIPGTTLPGPHDRWDRYRLKPPPGRKILPEPTEEVLRTFVKQERTVDNSPLWSLAFSDPFGREQLKREYFDRHPEELQRLRQSDEQKLKRARMEDGR